MPLHTQSHQGSRKPSSCATFTLNSHWGRAASGEEKACVCVSRVASVTSDSLRPCRLWPARLLCQAGGFSRQEHWSALANTGCHTFLEHCISCCPSRQPPENLVLPEALRPRQLHHLHTWSSQGQTQVLQGRLRS